MKIISLVQSEFVKNYSLKKIIIISLVMLIFSIFFVEGNKLLSHTMGKANYPSNDILIEELEKKPNLTLEEEFNLKTEKHREKYYKYLESLNVDWEDYRVHLVSDININYEENIAIEIFQKYYNDPDIRNICLSSNTYFDSYFQGTIHHICTSYQLSELSDLYNEHLEKINDYDEILKENKYYKYVEYQLNKGLISGEVYIKLAQSIVDKKVIKSDHFLNKNFIQHLDLYGNSERELVSETDFLKDNGYIQEYKSYDNYVRFHNFLKDYAKSGESIIEYSSEHNIKHDLSLSGYDYVYSHDKITNSKNSVNLIFHYSVVVMILVSITSSGIISQEHSKGTIKNIITAPVRRWKILLSKFIYLIGHAYIIWLIGLLFLSIYSGIRYGFSDLFAPKLIFASGKVIEINYYIYLLKNLFIASIPVISFLSLLLLLSSFTNTVITTSICSILSILSVIFWYLVAYANMKFLIYTPFLYLDTAFIHGRLDPYMYLLKTTNVSYNVGIIISLITTFILLMITLLFYSKRDIKN